MSAPPAPLPLESASRRLRRRPGRPRKGPQVVVASEASAPLSGPPSTRGNARPVAVVWLQRGEKWIPATARLLGLAAAASYMGVSTWTVRQWLTEGVVSRVQLPGADGREVDRLLFDVTDLDALIEAGKA
jgi:hypothetical protein